MGIPSFFKWMVHKYPKVVEPAMEVPVEVNAEGEEVPTNLLLPNPNNVEYDNLYLDMNGLVHPCCHSCDPLPKDEEEMMLRIFSMVDELVSIVRPRKLLYLALDGPAPRAKINQQRARRFKAAREQESHLQSEHEVEAMLKQSGRRPPSKPKSWDRNVITPGTYFMEKVTEALQWYVHERCNNDPYFEKLTVIFSDGSVPGEGEHKIMNYIRAARTRPYYNPNTRHCVYGMDADLVMLALTTHEPYFSVIREHIDWKNPQEKGRNKAVCDKGLSNYDFLHCNIVREYLEADLMHLKQRPLPMEYDFERCIDDFIFICFFCGNDFLPCLPSLEIREGGLDILIDYYAHNLENIGGYITDHGEVNMQRVSILLDCIGDKEELILQLRAQKNEARTKRFMKKQQSQRRRREADLQRLEEMLRTGARRKDPGDDLKDYWTALKEQKADVEGLQEDKVRYNEDGWKERFYQVKFEDSHQTDWRRAKVDAAYHYLIGVQWVMRYYFQGTASWTWCYPFHYPPFASDLCATANSFNKSLFQSIELPFSPVTQLLSVMPPESASAALPQACKWFMTHPDSPVIDMFPKEVKLDYVGCRYEWMGVILLPQIDEARLQQVAATVESRLTPIEKQRNVNGQEMIFAHISTKLGAYLHRINSREMGLSKEDPQRDVTEAVAELKKRYPQNMYTQHDYYDLESFPLFAVGEPGCAQPRDGVCPMDGVYRTSYTALGVDDLEDNKVVCATYLLPDYVPHTSPLLPDTIIPAPVLSEQDVLATAANVFDSVVDNPNSTQQPHAIRASDPNNELNQFRGGNKGFKDGPFGKKGGKGKGGDGYKGHKGGGKGYKGGKKGSGGGGKGSKYSPY